MIIFYQWKYASNTAKIFLNLLKSLALCQTLMPNFWKINLSALILYIFVSCSSNPLLYMKLLCIELYIATLFPLQLCNDAILYIYFEVFSPDNMFVYLFGIQVSHAVSLCLVRVNKLNKTLDQSKLLISFIMTLLFYQL